MPEPGAGAPTATGRPPGAYRPDLKASWITLDDLARFMIAAAGREDCLGDVLDVGGARAAAPGHVADRLSVVLGPPIRYRYITPREFGERMYDIFGQVAGQSREVYVDQLKRHTCSRTRPTPFRAEMEPVLERLPVPLTPMSHWLAQQS